MAFDADEKTQDPTPRRRQQMRERGEVARSQDLSSAVLLLGSFAVLVMTGPALLDYLAAMLIGSLSGQSWRHWLVAGGSSAGEMASQQFGAVAGGLAAVLLPVLGLIVLVTVAINLLQTGFLFVPGRLAPDFSRASPWAGIRRVFSSSASARLVFALAKIAAVAGVAVVSLYARREELLSIGGFELSAVALLAWEFCLWTCVKIGLALAVLAACDYVWQRLMLERRARMTPQEVREEMRELAGDAQTAGRRRGLQRDRALAAQPPMRVEPARGLD